MAGVADYGMPRTRTYTSGLPRRRGAINGLLLILLGAWGGLVPFFGPQIGLSFTHDAAWTFTWAKVWLEVLPAVAALIGGLGLIGTARHAGGVLWGWLAALGGAWFVVGNTVSQLWTNGRGEFGAPVAATVAGRTFEEIVFFTGLGVVIVFLAGVAIGRFTVPARQDAAIAVAPPETEWTEPATTSTDTTPESSAETTQAIPTDATQTMAPARHSATKETRPKAETS